VDNLVDLHTHILPGVDDGADSTEESVKMAEALHDMGFRHVFATPHHRLYSWEGLKPAFVRSRLGELEKTLSGRGLKIQLYPGMEYDLDDTLVKRAQDRPGGAGHLLVDIGFWDVPYNLKRQLDEVREIGVEIFLVHPERNGALCRQSKMLRTLIDSGIRFVGNLGSLAGLYGTRIRRDCLGILEADFYWAMASDLHSTEQASWVRKGLAQLGQKAGLSRMQDLLHDNPVQVIENMVEEKP
jgi:protein-tyrosine phosphatase